jgi:anti-sigma regulatory factor (Ser/Thr protein kinase)
MFVAVADLPGWAEWVGEPHVDVLRGVRREVDELLRRWGVPDVVAEEAGMVVGELVANVVVHAQTTFRLVVRREGLLLIVAVEDGCVGARPVKHLNLSIGRGLGLRLVSAIALRWGWDEHATGKTVWAEFLLPSRPER